MVTFIKLIKSPTRLSNHKAIQKGIDFNISEVFRISRNVFTFELRNLT